MELSKQLGKFTTQHSMLFMPIRSANTTCDVGGGGTGNRQTPGDSRTEHNRKAANEYTLSRNKLFTSALIGEGVGYINIFYLEDLNWLSLGLVDPVTGPPIAVVHETLVSAGGQLVEPTPPAPPHDSRVSRAV